MLLAMAAFVQQATLIGMSQAAAAFGFMPHPAMFLHGLAHVHDSLAGHVHVHDGDNGVGHVHGHADHDDDHGDDLAKAPFWSLGCTTACVSVPGPWAPLLRLAGLVEYFRDNLRAGVEPDGPSRPPSIPGIA
jgi:hypothetical protein